MKVVINKCYGGFGISPKAVIRYAEIAGFNVYPYQPERHDFNQIKRWNKGDDNIVIYWLKQDIGDNPTSDELNKAEWFHCDEIERNDPVLIQVIEELGEKSFGWASKLHIIEIPDGVEYQIEEYDGMEHIAEKHRTWA